MGNLILDIEKSPESNVNDLALEAGNLELTKYIAINLRPLQLHRACL